jgi:hypothetical protein
MIIADDPHKLYKGGMSMRDFFQRRLTANQQGLAQFLCGHLQKVPAMARGPHLLMSSLISFPIGARLLEKCDLPISTVYHAATIARENTLMNVSPAREKSLAANACSRVSGCHFPVPVNSMALSSSGCFCPFPTVKIF